MAAALGRARPTPPGSALGRRRFGGNTIVLWGAAALAVLAAPVPGIAGPAAPLAAASSPPPIGLAPAAAAAAAAPLAVVDRIVDGRFAVFLVEEDEQEWVVLLGPAPGSDGLPQVMAAGGLEPGTWGRLVPAGADPSAGGPAVYTFLPDAAATRGAQSRVAGKLEALRGRGQSGPDAPPAKLADKASPASWPVSASPAAAGGPACRQSAPGPAGWRLHPLPPTPAVPRPIPF